MNRLLSVLLFLSLSVSCRPEEHHSDSNNMNDHNKSHIPSQLLSDLYPSVKKFSAKGRKGWKVWSDKSTWKGKQLPAEGSVAVIPEKVNVKINSSVLSRLSAIEVNGTLLIENSQPIDIHVETVMVSSTGSLLIGSKNDPIDLDSPVNIKFIKLDSNRSHKDNFSLKRGLVSMGRVEVYGKEKKEYINVNPDLLGGAMSFRIEGGKPSNWQKGDELLIPATTFEKNETLENEIVKIKSVKRTQINIADPLRFDHVMKRKKVVANLSRSITFSSESTTPINDRGHVMLMMCGGSVIKYAKFVGLGRTDKRKIATDNSTSGGENTRGRYPVHFHKCGFEKTAKLIGNVIIGSPGWAVVNHSSNVIMKNNIAYDFAGAGFVTESGDELGTMDGNIAAGGLGLEPPRYLFRVMYIGAEAKKFNDRLRAGDLGFDGDGFWIQSPLMRFKNNIAAGNHGAGIMFYGIGLSHAHDLGGLVGVRSDILNKKFGIKISEKIKRKWNKKKVPYDHHLVQDVPVVEFKNNTSYANYMGLKVRYLQHDNIAVFGKENAGLVDFIEDWSGDGPLYKKSYLNQEISAMNLWHNFIGAHFTYNSKLKLSDFDILGRDSGENDVGLEQWHQSVNQMSFENVNISGYKVGGIVKDSLKVNLKGINAKDNDTNLVYWKAANHKQDRK